MSKVIFEMEHRVVTTRHWLVVFYHFEISNSCKTELRKTRRDHEV